MRRRRVVLTSFSSVKAKSVFVDMVKFKSSDPNSEKPHLFFFLFTIATWNSTNDPMAICRRPRMEMWDANVVHFWKLIPLMSSHLFCQKSHCTKFQIAHSHFNRTLLTRIKLLYHIYRLMPECRKGSAGAHAGTGSPRCKSGTWSISFRLPQRSNLRPPPLTW